MAEAVLKAGLAEAARCLRGATRIWIGTHSEPDGDAIGSLLGLRWLLAGIGKSVTVACQDPAPDDVLFLPGVAALTKLDPAGHDLAVAVDAGDLDRLGDLVDEADWRARPTLVLDHHISNQGFGTINVVDPDSASTAEIILRLADAMGITPDARAATCLLTGIVTDTIGFRTSSTTPATLASAQRLMASGADLERITQAVFYQRPLAALRLTGRALDRLEVRGRLAVTALASEDFRQLGATLAEARGISSFLAGARELDAVVVLHERDNGSIDVSMRSRPGFDLVPIAALLGGGGHPQASGARLNLPLSEAVTAVWTALAALSAVDNDGDTTP